MKNYYAVLGIDRGAVQADVRRRFHELAREKHPDRFRGDAKLGAEKDFQAITEAFNVLNNEERRRSHDQELSQSVVERRPQDPDRTVQAYMQRGVKAFRDAQWAHAADAFGNATEVNPVKIRSL